MAKRCGKACRGRQSAKGLRGLEDLAGLAIPVKIGKVRGVCRLARTRSRWKRKALRFVCKRVRRGKRAA